MTRTAQLTDVHTTSRREVLISGASIAGTALAFWLNRYGYAVTVVEKASALRSGGYPVDVRGTAREVVRRIGILPELQDAHIDLRRLTFLDGDGSEVTSIDTLDQSDHGVDVIFRGGQQAYVRHGVRCGRYAPLPSGEGRPAHSALTLPEFMPMT